MKLMFVGKSVYDKVKKAATHKFNVQEAILNEDNEKQLSKYKSMQLCFNILAKCIKTKFYLYIQP